MKSVILLHGWGLSGSTFAPLGTLLRKKGLNVFAPDFPGFGTTPAPEAPADLTFYVRFLASYIKKNAITKPILIGHSFGGRVALKYAYMYPSRVKSIILTGTPGYSPVAGTRRMLFVAGAKIGKIISMIWPFSLFQNAIRTWYYYVAGAREYARATEVMKGTFKKIVQENLEQYMKAVGVPCLLVWGKEDRITPLWIARRMNETIKHSRLIMLSGGDHGVSYKKPDLFADAIGQYL